MVLAELVPPGGDALDALSPSSGFDYELGGPYDPPDGTDIVVRDSSVDPVECAYNV